MKKPLTELIHIDPSLAMPVYKQIVQSICRNIDSGVLSKDDVLPSVNKIAEEFSLARGSVFTAYNDLRASGIIDSIPGKGYFVSSTQTKQNKRIFLLFGRFSASHEVLYQAILNSLPNTFKVHLFFHHHDIKTFETLIREQAGHYNLFVIMPELDNNTTSILSNLDPRRTLLLNFGYKEYKKDYAGVFQNFEKDIYSVLMMYPHLVSKYRRMTLVIPDNSEAKDIVAGFQKFTRKSNITAAVKNRIEGVEKGDALIVVDDNHLVDLVRLAKEKKWQMGKDIGVVSYNENNLKSVIDGGITTFSSDYEFMGKSIADMIVTGKRGVVENPYKLVDRKSF